MNAIIFRDQVLIDSGIVFFDNPTVIKLLDAHVKIILRNNRCFHL